MTRNNERDTLEEVRAGIIAIRNKINRELPAYEARVKKTEALIRKRTQRANRRLLKILVFVLASVAVRHCFNEVGG